MAKRILISLVPSNFEMFPHDEINLGILVHGYSDSMMEHGMIPYTALSVFKKAITFRDPKMQRRSAYLVLGEVVSRKLWTEWDLATRHLQPSIWIRALIDCAADKDLSVRPSQIIQEVLYDYER